MTENPELLGAGLVGAITTVAMVISKWLDHQKGKGRDRTHSSGMDSLKATLTTTINDGFKGVDRRMDTIELEVKAIKTAAFGLDGNNGLRGDLRRVEGRVDEMEERERDRLKFEQVVRRTGSV